MKTLLILIIPIALLSACGKKHPATVSTDTGRVATTDTSAQETDPTKIDMSGELPSKASVPALFYEMDYQQAVQCYLWAMPLVAIQVMKDNQEKIFGAKSSDLVLYNSYEDKLGILTANATTPYIVAFFNVAKTGPMVVDMPAGHIAGGLSDCWERA